MFVISSIIWYTDGWKFPDTTGKAKKNPMLKVYPFLTLTHSCEETFTRRCISIFLRLLEAAPFKKAWGFSFLLSWLLSRHTWSNPLTSTLFFCTFRCGLIGRTYRTARIAVQDAIDIQWCSVTVASSGPKLLLQSTQSTTRVKRKCFLPLQFNWTFHNAERLQQRNMARLVGARGFSFSPEKKQKQKKTKQSTNETNLYLSERITYLYWTRERNIDCSLVIVNNLSVEPTAVFFSKISMYIFAFYDHVHLESSGSCYWCWERRPYWRNLPLYRKNQRGSVGHSSKSKPNTPSLWQKQMGKTLFPHFSNISPRNIKTPHTN